MRIFNAWRKFDELNILIKSLWIVICMFLLLNLAMLVGWMHAPDKLRVYLPPDLSQGAMIKPGAIPKSTIYSFSYQIFSAINTWTNSGTTDYRKNINSYKNYLSPKFYNILLDDYKHRAANGALSRTRVMSGVSSMSYSQSDVQVLGSGTWLVKMHLQIVETVGSSVVKNVIMDYPVIISRVHESIQNNPWGLVIAGFYKDPHRVKTII